VTIVERLLHGRHGVLSVVSLVPGLSVMAVVAVEILLGLLLFIAFHLLVSFDFIPLMYLVIPLYLLMIHPSLCEQSIDLAPSQTACTVSVSTNVLVIGIAIGRFVKFQDVLLQKLDVVGIERGGVCCTHPDNPWRYNRGN